MLRGVALVRTDVSEELSASIFMVPPKRQRLQEPRGVTSQKTAYLKNNEVLKHTMGSPSETSLRNSVYWFLTIGSVDKMRHFAIWVF
jgi:hypothetical protein